MLNDVLRANYAVSVPTKTKNQNIAIEYIKYIVEYINGLYKSSRITIFNIK